MLKQRSRVVGEFAAAVPGVAPDREEAVIPPLLKGRSSLWRPMIRFAIPQTASAALQLLSGTVTAIYFGQLLGGSALAVASVFFPIFFLLISFLIGLISGGIVLVARAYGAGDLQDARAVVGTTLCICFSISVVIAIAGSWLAPELLGVMATPGDILGSAIGYARMTFVSLPLLTVLFAYAFLLRGTGDAQTPFVVMIVYFAISLLLTPALILGWAGLPQLGVTSAPWANMVATIIALPCLVVYLGVRRHPLAFDGRLMRRLRIDRKIVGPFFAIGIPGGVQTMVVALAEVAVITLVNSFGSSATAAYGAMNQVVGYLLAPMQAVGLAATVIAAQAIGARQLNGLHGVTRAGTILSVLVGTSSVAGLLLFSERILSWFVVDPQTLAIAVHALQIVLWSYVFVGVTDVLAGVMRSSGTVGWPTVMTLASVWLVQVPVAYLMSGTFGLDGVWMGYPAGFAAALVAQLAYYGFVWRYRMSRL
ncbi:putative multi antimicrobial extrusion protein, MatE [Bradyrhizobium oligotrophicum S58]|uniref:Putative multi antimicrobial extrusion protein, MatE n=1 Tax=Bradyrhizobium oligotrophicum S58 TaxID=1245469 RepID=M4Z764_9BRAD|nr:MATE family efflux transporter [Bradyrhizobium oligotrophicum]BAM88926.1 putative multi antimicrobial extrusion protein, MatE [Bradyrhizobium oligotrophicum S58]